MKYLAARRETRAAFPGAQASYVEHLTGLLRYGALKAILLLAAGAAYAAWKLFFA